jgi:glycosyltransferase involved in cell wall biosynthesis
MNILVILYGLGIGGAENYTISLINEFVKLGHTVDLRVLSNELDLIDRVSPMVNIKVWPRKAKLDLKVIRNIRNAFKSKTYDAVISSYVIYCKISQFLLRPELKILYPIHSTTTLRFKDIAFNYLIFKSKSRNEIFISSVDNQTDYLIRRYQLNKDFFRQIYNGIDTDRFCLPPANFNRKAFLESKGINSLHNIILMVAGFRTEKRHVDAIDAFRLLKSDHPLTSIVFVGNNDHSNCKKLAEYADEIPDIHFFTADLAGDVRNYYWSSDLFTLTSNSVETFPISSLEAMASGLPCVLTNIGGAKDIIISKFTGELSEPDNVQSIKDGWVNVLDNIESYDKLVIRKNIIDKYSLSNSVNEYLALISEQT